MKKSLLMFIALCLLSTTDYANLIAFKGNHELNIRTQSKLTVNLGDITNLTESDINNKIKLSTSSLAKSNYEKYLIVIGGSMHMEKVETFNFSIDIKGNLKEVQKELKTIAKVLIDLKNSK